MSGKPLSRRAQRHEATRDEILAAAWAIARDEGLPGVTMRDLGARVGMTAQSIYSYFASKHDIYDAMFGQGYRAFADWMAATDAELPARPSQAVLVAQARADAHRYAEFCVSDPVRFQLLFLRTIPGFVPSEASYTIALQTLEQMRVRLRALGVDDENGSDMWTAVMTGLVSQQIANDPGGDRWLRSLDSAVDMLLAHTSTRPVKKRSAR